MKVEVKKREVKTEPKIPGLFTNNEGEIFLITRGVGRDYYFVTTLKRKNGLYQTFMRFEDSLSQYKPLESGSQVTLINE